MIVHADCLDEMARMAPESVAAIVTDPPYGLGFMGKAWDRAAGPASFVERKAAGHTFDHVGGNHNPSSSADATRTRRVESARFEAWCWEWATAALRIATPGAYLLAFGGTRTVHRLTSAIEDAGWEIRDCLVWAYASGFPKSHNLDGDWNGWGTALKPAWEPIVMARKPLQGTVAANVLAHGTGALNIDGTRIAYTGADDLDETVKSQASWRPVHPGPAAINVGERQPFDGTRGRWPANVILTDPIFDGGIEGVVGGGETSSGLFRAGSQRAGIGYESGALGGPLLQDTYGDSGTYSRFFLIPKADRAEREPVGLRDFDQKRETAHRRTGDMDTPYLRGETQRRNTHPTVKPVDLMRHLVRLVTPKGGVVLDPFLGSGTTGIACEMEGFDWIGIEKEAEYVAIAEARLIGVQRGLGLDVA